MKWVFVAIIVLCTAAGEVLQAAGMRRHGEVSDVVPVTSARYALTAIAGPIILHETVDWKRWPGIALMIVAGVSLVSGGAEPRTFHAGVFAAPGAEKRQ